MKQLLYRIYLICVMMPVMLAVTVLTALITITGSLCGGGRWFGYYPPRLWARLFLLMTLVRV